MALIWADFPSEQKGLYGQDESFMLNGIWGALEGTHADIYIDIVDDPDPTIGSDGNVLRFQQGNTSFSLIVARMTYPAVVSTAGIAARIWLDEYPVGDSTSGNAHISFRTISNTDVAVITIGASGQFIVKNSAGTILHTSNPTDVIANAYNHVEAKLLRHASAGTLEIRVNGIVKVNLSGLALGATDVANVCVGQTQEASHINTRAVYFKDIIFWDGLGSYINDFQGNVFVRDIVPDGDSSFNWDPSTGVTGFNLIDEGASGPDDADYISADNTLPAASVFTMTDLPDDVTTVRAVMPIGRLVKSDGGDCTVLISVSPNGVDYDDGEDRPITVAPTYYKDVSYISPDTGSAWTPDEVNDMVYKIDRTT